MLKRSLVVVGVVLGLAFTGCSPPPTGSTSYLLLDRDAREGGLRVEAGSWQGAPMLPIALRPEEPVAILSAGGRLPVALRAGALAWVRGGAVEYHAIGVDMESEKLVVDGDDKAVRTLADLLGAEAGARGDGRWTLQAPELLTRASFMPVPDGVRDILPELLTGAASPTVNAAAAQNVVPGILTTGNGPDVAGSDLAGSVVGVYVEEGKTLILDGELGFTLSGCHGDLIQGRYRADGDHLELTPSSGEPFTLTVAPDALRDAAGNVLSPLGDEVSK